MVPYLLQVIVFQLLFVAVYMVWLKNETFFTYNRIYLLGTALVSFALPFIKFDLVNEHIPDLLRVQLPAVLLGESSSENAAILEVLAPVTSTSSAVNWSVVLMTMYFIGVGVTITLFIFKLYKITRLRKKGTLKLIQDYQLCVLPQSKQAFTFLKTMYLGDAILEEERSHIIAHEKIHIDQAHTVDLLLFEGLKILFWFNPMVYVYQKQLKIVHEFSADYAVAKGDKSEYYQKLLAQVFGTTTISFINTFFNHSLIKKRIIMLQKSESNRSSKLKYLLLIPFISGMLIYTSCQEETFEAIAVEEANQVSDLDHLTFSLSLDQEKRDLNLFSEQSTMQKEFMSNNSETHVTWMQIDTESNELVYSVHLATEATPEGYEMSEFEFSNGTRNRMITKIKKEENTLPMITVTETQAAEGVEGDVPFTVIDIAPVYPGCESQLNNVDSKKCFSDAINKHVRKNFNTNLTADLGLEGRQRVSVQFKIDKYGEITDVLARAPLPVLEVEAKRVMNLLPKMTPGKQNNEEVGVLYSLPIVFQVQ